MAVEKQINGRTYRIRRSVHSEFIHVYGPMEFKRPHHGMYDTERERWVMDYGLAGFEAHGGARVRRFYADANEAITQELG